ncbi:hypothetical protein [Minwuia sp.]|uniref:hypothetical protein n=1 Tax=Minwuia sp. TaxID=2493630 RepID=UPI003A900188
MDNPAGAAKIADASETVEGDGCQVIHVPNTLRAKVGSGTKIDPAMIRKAQAAIDDLAGDFRERAGNDLEKVHRLVGLSESRADELRAHYAEIFEVIHDLKGQGSTFGYTLLTSIGDNLCRYMMKHDEPSLEQLTIIAPHVDALRAVIRFDVQGGDDPIGQKIVDSLYELTLRMK